MSAQDTQLVTIVRVLAPWTRIVAVILAAALLVAAVAIGVFGFGGYQTAGARTAVAALLVAFAAVAALIGWSVPAIVRRLVGDG